MSWAENVNKMTSEAERRVVSAAIDRIGNQPTGKGRWQGYDQQGNPIAKDYKDQLVTTFHTFNAGLPQNTTISLDNLDVIGQQSYSPLQELEETKESEQFDDDFFLITREDGLAVFVRLRRRKDLVVKTKNEKGQEVEQELLKRYKADAVVLSYGATRTIEGGSGDRDSEFNMNNWARLFTGWALREVVRDREDVGGSSSSPQEQNFVEPSYIVRPWDFGVVLGSGFAGGGGTPMERNGYNFYIYNQGAQFEQANVSYDINWCYQSFGELATEFGGNRNIIGRDNEYNDAATLITVKNKSPDISKSIESHVYITQEVILQREGITYKLFIDTDDGYYDDVLSEKWGVYVAGKKLITSVGSNFNLPGEGYNAAGATHTGALDFDVTAYGYDIHTHPVELIGQDGRSFSWTLKHPFPNADYGSTVTLRLRSSSSSILFATESFPHDVNPYPPAGPTYLKVASEDQTAGDVTIVYEDIWDPGWLSEDRLYPNYTSGSGKLNINLRYFVDHSWQYLQPWGFGASLIIRKPKIYNDVIGQQVRAEYTLADGSKRLAKNHIFGPGTYYGKRWDFSSIPPVLLDYQEQTDGFSSYTTGFTITDSEDVIQPENSFRTISFSRGGSKTTDYTNGSSDLYYWPSMSFELYGQKFWLGSPSNIDGRAYRENPSAYTAYPALWTNWEVPVPIKFLDRNTVIACALETQKHKDRPSTSGNENEYEYVEWCIVSGETFTFRYGTLADFTSDPKFGGIVLASTPFVGTLYSDSQGIPLPPVSRMNHLSYVPDLRAIIQGGQFAKARRKQSEFAQTAVHLSKEGILSILRPNESGDRPPIVWSNTYEFDENIGKKAFQYNIFTGLKIPKHTQMGLNTNSNSVQEIEKAPEILALPTAATPIVSALFQNRNLHLTASRGRFIIGEI